MKKDFFKLMNNTVFGKTKKNVKKHRDAKLVTTETRRNYLLSERNYHAANFFSEKCISNRNKKQQLNYT